MRAILLCALLSGCVEVPPPTSVPRPVARPLRATPTHTLVPGGFLVRVTGFHGIRDTTIAAFAPDSTTLVSSLTVAPIISGGSGGWVWRTGDVVGSSLVGMVLMPGTR